MLSRIKSRLIIAKNPFEKFWTKQSNPHGTAIDKSLTETIVLKFCMLFIA